MKWLPVIVVVVLGFMAAGLAVEVIASNGLLFGLFVFGLLLVTVRAAILYIKG